MGRNMRVIIAGGREYSDYLEVVAAAQEWEYKMGVIELVCGEARGADSLGKRWATKEGREIHSFPADWDKNGKAAGHIRNADMANFSDGLIVFWDGKSKGTKSMIDLALKNGLYVRVIRY